MHDHAVCDVLPQSRSSCGWLLFGGGVSAVLLGASLAGRALRTPTADDAFDPGGDLIAAQRSRLDVPFPKPEVVAIDDTGRELEVIDGAATRRWLP